jgi:hypothetical protein
MTYALWLLNPSVTLCASLFQKVVLMSYSLLLLQLLLTQSTHTCYFEAKMSRLR